MIDSTARQLVGVLRNIPKYQLSVYAATCDDVWIGRTKLKARNIIWSFQQELQFVNDNYTRVKLSHKHSCRSKGHKTDPNGYSTASEHSFQLQ